MIKSRGNTHYIIRARYIIPALRGQALNIALAITILALIAVIAMLTWLSMTSPDALEIQRQQQAYFKALEQEFDKPASKRAWNRIFKSNGQHLRLICDPGGKPYNPKLTGQRCWFINEDKG